MKSISELKDNIFVIPTHQRGYRWRNDNVEALLNDIKEFIEEKKPSINQKRVYCLQPLAVTEITPNKYNVEDGQQRLTTLFLLHKYLFKNNNDFYSFDFESDIKGIRKSYLTDEIDNTNYKDQSDINLYHIGWAYTSIKEWFVNGLGKGCEEEFKTLLNADSKHDSIQFIWYVVDKGKAREVFRDLNYGKIRLTGTDLIKALLLSKDNGLAEEDRAVIGQQLEDMQVMMENDRFWFMYQHSDPIYHTDRMDFLFNLTENVSEDDYHHFPYLAFSKFNKAQKENKLLEEWGKVRTLYIILNDLYENPYYYHYIGYLVNRTKNFTLRYWIKLYEDESKIQFLLKMKQEIKEQLPNKSIGQFSYGDDSQETLRSILILHNIETILHVYRNNKKEYGSEQEFERFPFDLLQKEKWDIEHIASQTDNPLTRKSDWDEWVESTFDDFSQLKSNDILKKAYDSYYKEPNKLNFNELYKGVLAELDKQLGELKINDSDKDKLGNLVLLDRHTNRSYHNALYPKKRRTIISSPRYIPVCTRQTFMKYYNKNKDIKMLAWTKDDFADYMNDINRKLSIYFGSEETNNK